MSAKKPQPDEKPQRERFIEAVRKIGADETKEGFEAAFKKIIAPRSSQGKPEKTPNGP